MSDVFADYQCVVYHHSHHENHTRKRNYIQRPTRKIKHHKCNHHSRYHTDSYYDRLTDAAHKKYRNYDYQDETEYQVLFEIGDCVIQKFGLIAADLEFQVWKLRRKLRHKFADASAHLFHSLVCLFYNRQCHNTLPISQRKTLLLLRLHSDVAKIAELQVMTVDSYINILHVVDVSQERGNPHRIFVNAVFYANRTRFYIIGSQHIANITWRDIEKTHFVVIGRYFDALLRYARNVSHRHFGELFDAAADDVFHGVAHFEKFGFVAAVDV